MEDLRVAPRLCALDGVSRAEAAWLYGMDRQALRNALVHLDAGGLYGRRFTRTRVLAAIQPATGNSTAPVLPEVAPCTMGWVLERFPPSAGLTSTP